MRLFGSELKVMCQKDTDESHSRRMTSVASKSNRKAMNRNLSN